MDIGSDRAEIYLQERVSKNELTFTGVSHTWREVKESQAGITKYGLLLVPFHSSINEMKLVIPKLRGGGGTLKHRP